MKRKSNSRSGLFLRGKTYWMSFTFDGKNFRKSTGAHDIKVAQRILDALKAKISLGQWHPELTSDQPDHTFKELSERYAAWAEGRQRAWHCSQKHMVNRLTREFGGESLKNFTPALLEQFQSSELKRGLAPGGVNRKVSKLKSMLSKAVDWEMIPESHLLKVRKVKAIRGEQKRLRFLSKEECQALINACDFSIKPVVQTALFSGMRRGEILSLKWSQVDLKHGFILLDKTKNGDRREIPINDTLRGVFQGLTRRLDIPYVFLE